MGAIMLSTVTILLGGSMFCQQSDIKFEVAAMRRSAESTSSPANSGWRGGPGTSDPERFTVTNLPLVNLLLKAYGVQRYQISGPDWLSSTRFHLEAKVAPGTTEVQLNVMIQNLLAERFNLTFHHETKELAVYELTVATNGPKLQEANMDVHPPSVREPGSPPPTIGEPDSVGFPQIPSGRPIMLGRMTNGIMRWTGKIQSLANLASFLGGELERPVLDKTGLNGQYDFTLAYSRDGLRPMGPAAAPGVPSADPSGGPSLFKAVQEQLGLRLDQKRDGVDILVLDHIDKVPTEN